MRRLQWRLAALIRQLGRGLGYLKPQFVHRLVDGAAHSQIATATTSREPRQARQEQADHLVHVADRFLQRDQVPLLLSNAEPDQFGLRPLKISVRLTAWRLPPLAPQVSQVGNAALTLDREEIVAVAHSLDENERAVEHQRHKSCEGQLRLAVQRAEIGCREVWKNHSEAGESDEHGQGGARSLDLKSLFVMTGTAPEQTCTDDAIAYNHDGGKNRVAC